VGRFDVVGTVASIAAIGLLVLTVIEAPRWGWTAPATIAGFVGSALLLAAFVWWELRVDKPLINVRIFRIPRFSAAAGSIAVAFFCLFGFIFIITQYFQFVLGYSTLEAGVHTLPFAVFAGITAPIAARLALRHGPRRVVATGLSSLAVGLVLASTVEVDSAYWGPIIVSMAFLAIGLSLVTAPATEAVMSSLPKEQAGAGAAVNDLTREVGGVLGVAVVGSVFASVFGPALGRGVAAFPIPADVLDVAKESVAAALAVAAQAPEVARTPIADAARASFMDGMAAGSLTAAGFAVLGAVAALVFLPDRERVAEAPVGLAIEGREA
jgi:MFS family permease